MCFPAIAAALPAISAGLGAGSAILGYAGQRQQAKAQAAYQAQSIAAAQRKAGFQRTSEILEAQQKRLALAQETGKVTKASKEKLASATVAAGEAGVSGLSVQALMDDYVRQQAGQVAALTSQDKLYALRHGLNLQQLAMASEQEIQGLSRPIEKPSALRAGLSILQSGVGAYGTYKTLQALERPAFIDTGMGISSYMPGSDQYTLPARGPLAIGGR